MTEFLDYIFAKEILMGDRIKYNLSDFTNAFHSEILLGWMVNGFIPDAYEIFELLKIDEIVSANMYFAELGDLIIHNSKRVDCPFHIIYCPENLGEYQKLRLRLWWEYFRKNERIFEMSRWCDGKVLSYNTREANLFLEEQVGDDSYIRTLMRKYQD